MWNTKDDCQFCNINHTLKEQKSGGEESIVRKSIDQITEVLETAISIDRLCQRQIIVSGGMIPKVTCCIDALNEGVKAAVIIDGRVPHATLMEILTDEGAGTLITKE